VRPDRAMTTWRRARPGVRALMFGIPASAATLGAGQALAAPAADPIHVTPKFEEVSFFGGLTGGSTASASGAVPADVASRVRIHSRRTAVLSGQTVLLRGRLVPGLAGRTVALQALESGGWHTLATTRTRAAGTFVLRYATGNAGQAPLRVRFAGDRLGRRATAQAGEMTVYREAGASWYNDGGNTACGFHAYYGVANRTLPCGTKVSLRYNGRSVTATVDDRGPYVAGRDWDLNQNTASALGFGGVGVVWSSQ
jgi:peptidoglycan lytic transglycosylase